jgi:sugar O-acyltransferase (sialic acid O-acetyltransferase NeuD family)
MKVLILGAAQHAEVVASMACDYDTVEVVGFLDDDPNKLGTRILGFPVLGGICDLEKFCGKGNIEGVFLGLSARQIRLRKELINRISDIGIPQPNLIHSTAWIAPTASLGQGNFMAPYVVVNHHAKVGDSCAFYSHAVVEHHSCIGDNVYMGPGSKTTADVVIGADTYVGVNASFIPHVSVPPSSTIAAGCVVTKCQKKAGLIAGVPGVLKKEYN